MEDRRRKTNVVRQLKGRMGEEEKRRRGEGEKGRIGDFLIPV
jgi:hypothetical protein